ncbi:leucine-rich repeat domain-containing protein [Mucilaginibacter xinganensis]|uniref:Leucine-rich repeat domain-containing protein n=1 Tax=Mucilaginibacter xinganensis TaxID=1234841 RepID=A0A223P1W6_9SPHI|nr:leucine-rich repeat domain-containing protein [Mucilaginibacter xinganensis]ASU35934.1 hypothetical protein MuYL_4049 [Mucilaginibacter xinganensis]
MKILTFFSFLILVTNAVYSRDKYFYPTYVYEGYIEINPGHKVPIYLNLLIAKNLSVNGLYYYKAENGSLSLSGTINSDNTITLAEKTNTGKITGNFAGWIAADKDIISGNWTSTDNKTYPFIAKHKANHSYWGYIRRFEKLLDFKDFKSAIKDPSKVEKLYIYDKGIKSLPSGFSKFNNVISVCLMADKFNNFPVALTRLRNVEEISLASNQVNEITSKISRLQNLRLLYVDFNKLTKLPKEIGALHNLLYLDLSSNKITSVPDEIKNLYQLQELHLENNPIDETEKYRIRKLLPNCVIYF